MEKWAVDRVVSLIIDEAFEICEQAKNEYEDYLENGKPSRRVTALQIAHSATCLYEVANRLYEDLANDFSGEE